MKKKLNSDEQLVNYLENISRANKKRNIILRGLLNGVFTAIGATLGFAIFIFLFANVISSLRQYSLVDSFLADTKLDVIIESQLKEIESRDSEAKGTDSEDSENQFFLNYSNDLLGIHFRYPASLTELNQYLIDSEDEQSASLVISMKGYGLISDVQIHINNANLIISGDSVNYNVQNTNNEIMMKVFEKGAVVDGTIISEPVFYFQITKNQSVYDVIGIGDSNAPKTSREIFLVIPESITIDN